MFTKAADSERSSLTSWFFWLDSFNLTLVSVMWTTQFRETCEKVTQVLFNLVMYVKSIVYMCRLHLLCDLEDQSARRVVIPVIKHGLLVGGWKRKVSVDDDKAEIVRGVIPANPKNQSEAQS